MPAAAASAPIAQAFRVVRRALKILADREVSPQTGLLKSTLLQLDSTFSERNYGASSFLDFVEKLAQAGFVHLKHVRPQRDGGAERRLRRRSRGRRPTATTLPRRRLRRPALRADRRSRRAHGARAAGSPDGSRGSTARSEPAGAGSPARQEPAGPPLGDQADGVPRAGQHPRRRDQRALADVSAQRETDPAPGRGRLRRAPLRVRRADGSAEGLPARRLRPGRARSPRRPARVPGLGAAGRGAAAPVSRPNLPQPDVEEYENQPIETPRAEPIDAASPCRRPRSGRFPSRFPPAGWSA